MGLRKIGSFLWMFSLLALIPARDVGSTVELVANSKAEETAHASENKPKISTPINQTPIDNKPIDATPITNEALDINPIHKGGRESGYKSQKGPWVELHGSLNKQYVYLIVEKTGKRDIVGYLFDGKGNHSYVYGEWFKGQLQVYDQTNKRLTILLDD
jgi:hypothetical protein